MLGTTSPKSTTDEVVPESTSIGSVKPLPDEETTLHPVQVALGRLFPLESVHAVALYVFRMNQA